MYVFIFLRFYYEYCKKNFCGLCVLSVLFRSLGVLDIMCIGLGEDYRENYRWRLYFVIYLG